VTVSVICILAGLPRSPSLAGELSQMGWLRPGRPGLGESIWH